MNLLFLKSLALSTFALSAICLAATPEVMDVDVVVVGSGGTGLSAAAAAHQKGSNVLVIEKLPMVGGSSAFSGGAIAAGNSNAQKRAGMENLTPEGFAEIWIKDQERSYPGGNPEYPDTQRIRNITDQFTVTVNWLEDSIGHKYATPRPFGYGGPNYAHAPAESPVPASGRGSSSGGGQYVIKALKNYLAKENVPILTNTAATEILTNENGDAVGVKAKGKDKDLEIHAKAVVLGTGGFAHNQEMLRRLVPSYAPYAKDSRASVGDTGDGINMAKAVGAEEYPDAWTIGLFLSSPVKGLDATYTTKNKYKDSLFVNEKGERFVNENLPYLTDAIAAQGAAWAIVDSKDPQKVVILEQYNDPNIAVKGNSIEELATAMGVPPESLRKTLDTYNSDSKAGKDSTFNKPAEHMLPFEVGPFYAVRVIPQTGGTIGGVKTNEKFQVLRKDGSVIKGLYAGGETANRPYYGRVYTSGSGLGIAYTSGRIAGENAAMEK